MKKTSVIIMALFLAVFGYSQNENRQKTRSEVKEYITESVFPLIEQQQEKYLNELSEDEKSKLAEIKGTIGSRYSDGGSNNRRDGKRGKGRSRNSPERTEIQNEIKSITDAHPALNDSYTEFIESHKQKWISDIKLIHEKNDVDPVQNRSGEPGYEKFIDRISNPDWLLLFDADNPGMEDLRSMRYRNGIRKGYPGGSIINSEQRAEMKSYALENIIPVIKEEREDFDKQLTDDERAIIEEARTKIKARKEIFRQCYASEDYIPGQRVKDPKFDNMREDMRNSMEKVRDISISHESEIDEHLLVISDYKEQWRNDLMAITEKYSNTPLETRKAMRKVMRRFNTPVGFVLFNHELDENDIYNMNENISVLIYPNPVIKNATIAVLGANGMKTKVSLFSKDGEQLKVLYNKMNNSDRLELEFNANDMSGNVYLVKIIAGESVITRKIIVK